MGRCKGLWSAKNSITMLCTFESARDCGPHETIEGASATTTVQRHVLLPARWKDRITCCCI